MQKIFQGKKFYMKSEIQITNGSLLKNIFLFSIPLVFTNILQILFNMADSSVVGRFAGALALGAVGSDGQLCFLCSGLLIGIGGGVNVLVAFYIGQNNRKELNDMIHTAAVFCLISGFAIMIIGWGSAPLVLKTMKTKPELLQDALLYFRIYLLSMPAMALYNFGNAVLSAQGNTKLPLIFLALAGIVNVFLDLLLVIVFKMSVAGVAIATVAAQYISCVLTVRATFRNSENFHFDRRLFKLNSHKTLQLVKIGIPAGLQNVVFAVANLFIQAGVNSFDALMVAGNAATMNGDNLVYNIMAAFYTAGATFIGQNYGARKKSRILKSYFVSAGYAAIVGIFLGLILYIFGHQFLGLFTTDSTVVDYAMKKFKIMTFSFGISAFMDGTIAANRGLGKTFVPSIFVFVGSCVFRVVWIYTVFAYFRTIESLFLLYPVSWFVTAVFEIIYFAITYRKETRNL